MTSEVVNGAAAVRVIVLGVTVLGVTSNNPLCYFLIMVAAVSAFVLIQLPPLSEINKEDCCWEVASFSLHLEDSIKWYLVLLPSLEASR